MKALILAAALAALSSTALAGAAHDPRLPATVDATTATVIADAGRLGSASLTALNGNNSHWTPAEREAQADAAPFETLVPDVDTGTLVMGIGIVALLLSRPLSRLLRRQEEQRRATALASTLSQSPRH